MRRGIVKYNSEVVGLLTEEDNGEYTFVYDESYVQNHHRYPCQARQCCERTRIQVRFERYSYNYHR